MCFSFVVLKSIRIGSKIKYRLTNLITSKSEGYIGLPPPKEQADGQITNHILVIYLEYQNQSIIVIILFRIMQL